MDQDARPADSAIYVFGSFTLDSRSRRLLQHGAVVPLTTKAFDTLEMLVRAAGRTVTKDELLKRVWAGTYVQEDTLSQNISTLRKALGDPADSPCYVLTVPREGYRFVAAVDIVRPQPVMEGLRPAEQPPPAFLRRAPATRIRRYLYYLAGAASAVMLAAIAFIFWGLPRLLSPPSVAPFSFEVFEPEGSRFSTTGGVLTISPDGRYLAFLASDADGKDNLWVRPVDSLRSTRLEGTLDASQPFWSADSRSIAFFSGGSLRRVAILGGAPRSVCNLPRANALAGSWNRDGVIIFALNGQGIFQVNASGGTPAPLAIPGMGSCNDCRWPSFLPDGNRFLFTVKRAPPDNGIYLGSLDAATPRHILEEVSSSTFMAVGTYDIRALLRSAHAAVFSRTYASPGYLLYASAGALVARQFDPVQAQVSGDAVPVADRVAYNLGTHRAVFSVSQTGLLAYREPLVCRLRWISRAGTAISTGPEGVYDRFSVSRDGRVLTSELDPRLGTYDLWLHDPDWRARKRLTFDPADDLRPVWSDDGSRVVFAREGRTGWQLYDVSVDAPGVERPLLPEPSRKPVTPNSWNGDALVYSTFEPGESGGVWTLRPGRGDRPTPTGVGQVSPDGKWLASTTSMADARGPQMALIMRPRSGGSGQWEIAPAGGTPRWSTDSHELFFIGPGGRLMAQRIGAGGTIGTPVQLCTTEALPGSGLAGQPYDAAPDGQRFLIKVPARRPSIVVMSGWLTHADR